MTNPNYRDDAQSILDHVPAHAITHPRLRIIERHRLSIRRGLSFHAIMIQRSEASRHAGVKDPAWLLDSKESGYRFLDALDLPRPKTASEAIPLKKVELRPGTVLKPERATGARGVFAVISDQQVIDIRASETLTDWGQVYHRARQLMASDTRPVRDRWLVEELVTDETGGLARDLKFFAFYGRVLFIQEIARIPKFKATFWSPTNKPLKTGKPALLTDGYGVSEEQVEMVERLSLEIPAPFMRIDALRSGPTQLSIGEFTPRPGQFEEFNAETDRVMAEEWVRAERRLLDDALSGKVFSAFSEATNE